MSRQIEDESYIRRYLLGELSEEEREQIERRLLADEDYYQQVLIAEDELIYDFVCDELPEQEKTTFRRHILPVPERREDVKFAGLLRKYVRENAPRVAETPTPGSGRTSWLEPFAAFFRRPAVGFSLAAAAALLLAVSLSVWTAIQNRRLRNQIAQLEAQRTLPPPPPQDVQEQLAAERRRNANLTDELRREQEQRASVERDLEVIKKQTERTTAPESPRRTSVAAVVSFLLTPGASRDSGEVKRVSVPRDAREIRLQLDLAADNYPGYRAVLKTVGGQKELLSRETLRARVVGGRITVSMNLPAKILSRGDYQIQLSGKTSAGEYEDVDTYYFRVPQ
jgi:hypothetical protein